ncbi:MAG: hypothetical protein DCF25_19740 [Leptolyngbya foveolarum]|uniref:Uncharacterized protein n=1 Tax=Leptolyngbya foveolarum TaxID=47253 RepID=A0A2W4TQ01_9CYAN|nr:MAG: hypothetical protein DCF25_19740 [Leptolyngbya foveolarum]
MEKATKTAPKSSELATADHSAITVKSEPVAPIANDVSSAWDAFSSRPGVAATLSAFRVAASGFKWLWAQEQEFGNVRKFLIFLKDAFNAVALPLLSLVWLALNHLYQWSRKPETKTAVVSRWQSVKGWASPKFAYEREADRQVELTLND